MVHCYGTHEAISLTDNSFYRDAERSRKQALSLSLSSRSDSVYLGDNVDSGCGGVRRGLQHICL